MKEEKDYIRDIAEIRSMMERTSKFLSLSGWAGIMAGIYALIGAWMAYELFYFNPDEVVYSAIKVRNGSPTIWKLAILAVGILVMAVGTAVVLSYKKGKKRGEKVWNAVSRRLLINMMVPLVAGGVLVLILVSKGLLGLIAPFTLIFYGMALYNAGRFTYGEVRALGVFEIVLGLIGANFIGYGLLLWALGFGVLHIVYGIYIYYRYER